MLNLNGKIFKSVENSENGEVSGDTTFLYHQDGNLVWAEYSGGTIIKGHLIAIMNTESFLEMKYHHVNKNNEIMTVICKSQPKIKDDGKIRYYENWVWTCKDNSCGKSIIDEV